MLATATAGVGETSVTLSGTFFNAMAVTVKTPGKEQSDALTLPTTTTDSVAPSEANITATHGSGNTVVTVSGLLEGDVIDVYTPNGYMSYVGEPHYVYTKGTHLGTSAPVASGENSTTITITGNEQAHAIVTVTSVHRTESGLTYK